MDINKLVDLADAYACLGGAVQEQLGNLLDAAQADDGEDVYASVNASAARLIAEWASRAVTAGVDDASLLYDVASERAGM